MRIVPFEPRHASAWRDLDQAEAEGPPRLYLETSSRLTPALSFHQSAGFVQLPPARTPYARCDVWMERRL